MATRIKTIQFAFDLNTGTTTDAVFYEFPTQTLYIPENSVGSPVTFRSATVEIGFQDVITATGGTINEHRCGLSLNGQPYTVITHTDDLTNSAEKVSGVIAPFDFTSVFTSGFGTGTSRTCNIEVYFDQSTGTTLGMRNVSAVVTITYEYDDSASTHIKTAWIPLESLTGALPTAAGTQMGTNQIPQLTGAGGMLPESSIVIRDYFFVIEGNDATSSTTDWTFNVQTDTQTSAAAGVQESALNTAAFVRWIWSRKSDFPATSAAHQYKMWGTTARFNHGTVTLVVTYEFAASSTSVLNSVYVPIEISSPIGVPASTEASRFRRDLYVAEPGTITLKQSAFRLNFNTAASVAGINMRAGSQSFRAYTNVAGAVAGMFSIQQRIDSGSAQGAGMTLTRGKNTLSIDMYATDTTNLMTNVNGYAIINYQSTTPSQGVGAQNHTIFQVLSPWNATLVNSVRIDGYSVSIPETSYWRNATAFVFYQWIQSASAAITFDAECLSTEGKGGGYYDVYADAYQGDNELNCSIVWMRGQDVFRRYPLDPGSDRIDIENARDFRLYTTTATHNGMMAVVTYHSITFTVSGTISGSAGGTVTINTYRTDTNELINTTTRTGNGSYSFTWYDDTISLFTEAIEGTTRYGRSTNATAGTALNVTMLAQAVARSYA